MNKQRVTDEELSAILRDVKADDINAWCDGFAFHRVQDGYGDKVPRAVFVHHDEEPVGVRLGGAYAVLMLLVGRLAADLSEARAASAKIREAEER